MKYYAIFTPKYFSSFETLGSYCALAQYVLKDHEYAEQLLYRSAHGAHILLDNGAAEGEMVTYENLMRAAELCGADEIVLPDVQYDSYKTLQLATDTLSKSIPETSTMLVIHGNTKEEWRETIMWAFQRDYHGVLGLPKYIDKSKAGRENLLYLLAHMGAHRRFKVHLLGLYGDSNKVMQYNLLFPWIRSIDTAAPLAYAQHDVLMEDIAAPCSLEWGAEVASIKLLEDNIERMVELCI